MVTCELIISTILELYLNEIYLGNHAYGVASAAIQYFNKPLESLSIAEIAYLAALPKAPNFYNATKHPQAALYRRNWVIQRMLEENFITSQQALEATQTPLKYDIASPTDLIRADHCAELIRQHLYKNYGPDSLYKGGLTVKTTLNASLQAYARQSLREGLIAYDRQAGWRGPLAHIPLGDWKTSLNRIKIPLGVPFWTTAVVLQLTPTHAIIGLKNGNPGTISFENMKWARKYIAPQPPSIGVRRNHDGSANRVKTCPSCSSPLPTALPVCSNCSYIEPIPKSMSYHEML